MTICLLNDTLLSPSERYEIGFSVRQQDKGLQTHLSNDQPARHELPLFLGCFVVHYSQPVQIATSPSNESELVL